MIEDKKLAPQAYRTVVRFHNRCRGGVSPPATVAFALTLSAGGETPPLQRFGTTLHMVSLRRAAQKSCALHNSLMRTSSFKSCRTAMTLSLANAADG